MQEASNAFEGWAILELMGHRRLGGFVREITIAGAGMLRIDVPGKEGEPDVYATQVYSPSAIYCLTPTTEAMARAAAAAGRPEPMHEWELRAAVPAIAGTVTLCYECGAGFAPGEDATTNPGGRVVHVVCDPERSDEEEIPL